MWAAADAVTTPHVDLAAAAHNSTATVPIFSIMLSRVSVLHLELIENQSLP
jgi:hypothetical protein